MKITLEQAMDFAKKTKDIGCCSLSGQSLILMLDEIKLLEKFLNLQSAQINSLLLKTKP